MSMQASDFYQINKERMLFLEQKYADLLHKNVVASVSVQWINSVVGYGLFALEALPKDSFIGEYAGRLKVIKKSEAYNYSYAWKYPLGETDEVMMIVDAKNLGNELRFVNHSVDCNVKVVYVTGYDRRIHVCFIALKDIVKGQQLLIHYGSINWGDKEPSVLHP